MLRGYLVYILMLLVTAAGLWAVMRSGASLQAPAEIAGTWDVRWETVSPTGSGYHGTMTIDQSGRYCTFEFDSARTISLKMVGGAAMGQTGRQQPLARLIGGGYEMTLDPAEPRGAVRLTITGRESHRGVAERISRPSEHITVSEGISPTLAPVADARR